MSETEKSENREKPPSEVLSKCCYRREDGKISIAPLIEMMKKNGGVSEDILHALYPRPKKKK